MIGPKVFGRSFSEELSVSVIEITFENLYKHRIQVFSPVLGIPSLLYSH